MSSCCGPGCRSSQSHARGRPSCCYGNPGGSYLQATNESKPANACAPVLCVCPTYKTCKPTAVENFPSLLSAFAGASRATARPFLCQRARCAPPVVSAGGGWAAGRRGVCSSYSCTGPEAFSTFRPRIESYIHIFTTCNGWPRATSITESQRWQKRHAASARWKLRWGWRILLDRAQRVIHTQHDAASGRQTGVAAGRGGSAWSHPQQRSAE